LRFYTALHLRGMTVLHSSNGENGYAYREREMALLLDAEQMTQYRALTPDRQLYAAYFVMNGDTFEKALEFISQQTEHSASAYPRI